MSEQMFNHLQNSQYVQALIPEQNKRKGVLKTKEDVGVLTWNVLRPSDYSASNLNMHPNNNTKHLAALKNHSALLEQVSSREAESKRLCFHDAYLFFPHPFWNSPDHASYLPTTNMPSIPASVRFSTLSPVTFRL